LDVGSSPDRDADSRSFKGLFFYPCEIRAIHQQILLTTQEVVDEIFLMGGIVRFWCWSGSGSGSKKF